MLTSRNNSHGQGRSNGSSTVFSRVAASLVQRDPALLEEARRIAAKSLPTAEDLKQSVWLGARGEGGAVYVNRETGKHYHPHSDAERRFVYSDGPRRALVRGGEGSGKSVAGIIKDLERLRRGMSGIMGSPDFVHFRKSLWKEFQRWCPPNALSPRQRYRLNLDWQPNQPFELVFVSGATLLCGGFDTPGSWEGPNVNFGHFDEARQHPKPSMAKVLDGRCRIPGARGELPQWWITTTPRKSPLPGGLDEMEHHWLYVMFGPWDKVGEADPYAEFKAEASDTVLLLDDNRDNLAEGFVEQRRQSLTAKEARVLADAEWEDDEDTRRFLDNMLWWDACQETLPPLGARDPLVLAVDAATGRKNQASDCFGIVGVTRHPADRKRVAVRFVQKWQARPGEKISYAGTADNPGPRVVLQRLCTEYNVKCVAYDEYQLVSLMQDLEREQRVWCDPFSQSGDRLAADKQLLDVILDKRFAHGGEVDLRQHIDNADRKVDEDGSRFRLVKGRGKIDLAVCASMANARCLELNM